MEKKKKKEDDVKSRIFKLLNREDDVPLQKKRKKEEKGFNGIYDLSLSNHRYKDGIKQTRKALPLSSQRNKNQSSVSNIKLGSPPHC